MLPKLDFRPAEAAAFWYLGHMSSAEFETISERWLLDDLGDQELSVTAFGVPKNRIDAEPLVQNTLTELGVTSLSKKQLGWLAIHASLSRLLDGRWPTYEAARLIIEVEDEFKVIPLFDGADPQLLEVRKKQGYLQDSDKLYAGEGCRINGIISSYYSKDDYSYDANVQKEDYESHIKAVDIVVNQNIIAEATIAWNNYFSLTAKLPDEYEKLKSLLDL